MLGDAKRPSNQYCEWSTRLPQFRLILPPPVGVKRTLTTPTITTYNQVTGNAGRYSKVHASPDKTENGRDKSLTACQ